MIENEPLKGEWDTESYEYSKEIIDGMLSGAYKGLVLTREEVAGYREMVEAELGKFMTIDGYLEALEKTTVTNMTIPVMYGHDQPVEVRIYRPKSSGN